MLYLDIDRPLKRSLMENLPLSFSTKGILTRSEVQSHLTRKNPLLAADRIFVLTQPKMVGPSFNPVNFYFCYHDESLCAIIADINNTPWDERHCYVLETEHAQPEYLFEVPKAFHVSPFLPMEGHYRWKCRLTSQEIQISMTFVRNQIDTFFADLNLSTAELTRPRLLAGFIRSPAQNFLTLGRIYWQAAKLYMKRTPFYPHPSTPSERSKV